MELLQEQKLLSLQLENPRMLMQSRRAAKPREQVGHLPRTLRSLMQKELPVRIALRKNNLRLPRSLRAWAESGTEALLKRRALPKGGTSLRA